MSTLEATVEELKRLPPAKLAEAAGYIHKLTVTGGAAGRQALENAFGCLTSSVVFDRASRQLSHYDLHHAPL